MLTSTFHSNFNGYSFFVYCLRLVVSSQTFPTRFDVFFKMGFPRIKRLKPFLFTFPLSPPVCLCATIYTRNGCNFIAFGNFIWWVPHKLCGTKLNSNKYAKPNLELICHFSYFALVFLSSTLTTFVQYSTGIYIYIYILYIYCMCCINRLCTYTAKRTNNWNGAVLNTQTTGNRPYA